MAWDAPAPWDYISWQLIRETGWSLEYVENLPMAVIHKWLQIRDAESKSGRSINTRKG